jgi:hypothetical protein
MSTTSSLQSLIQSYHQSPHPSFKVANYFPIYVDLFDHLRGTACTFIETGILSGGSLFMWREWLGPRARIIGLDLNPQAERWRTSGFEIYIGDQGDPAFWRETFRRIGAFDALLDDGGHQSFQQIVTVTEALRAAQRRCVIAIEDTCTSLMQEFARHRQHTFSEYAKDATDTLLANTTCLFPDQFPPIDNPASVQQFRQVYSLEFFAGIVAFKVDPAKVVQPALIWNRPPADIPSDFRYEGVDSAVVEWPDPFARRTVVVRGQPQKAKP